MLLRTPLGRQQFRHGVFYQLWPLLAPIAAAHRATISHSVRIVAVVGSLGKTTTARAVIAALTGDHEPRLAENHQSFVASAVLRMQPRDRHGVVEVGVDRPGQMAAYARLLQPNVAVVTSIASEHNRSLGGLETTRAEKAEMVRALPSGGLAVLNGDDPNVRWMAEHTRGRVLTFGLSRENDVRATDLALDWPYGTRLTLVAGGRRHAIRVQLLGPQMAFAVLAAVAVVLGESRELEPALATLERLAPTPLRLEPVHLPNGAYLLRDEFKSTLETVHAALDVLAEIPARRRLVVIGDVSEPPGSQGPIYREIGERIARIAERAVVVGHGYQAYAAGATRAGMPRAALLDAGSSVLRAVEALRGELQPGDVVLLKGRDTQRLDRIAHGLLGQSVRCGVSTAQPLHAAGPVQCSSVAGKATAS
jgi:UDP-N-acetylmuramyl pentapeptide synthase